ncbi:ABC transporter substrate-binding protein [Mycolicibacterium madagascariense]|uniref:ABC transporter substrate-binding protein n=1 Tax=Mycolicibacterium madagascariense TaxID=212765 RepID=A0A7I7XBZ5_9MYCO|nr:ABC transporter substrate-binding protein [Mycolicibacterium madagascariense]MCV7012894.1 ABC transporter substrate-binding protein [Mycolicibacterium madagascariense]BBZ26141.1 ABC transporter substrate-binding protein [Mycolicibacterium madagascariense]
MRPTGPSLRAARTLALLCTLLLAAATLSACGTTTPAAPAPAADAVTVSHQFGETRIPANPQRVVTAGWIDQDFVLALGVVPVGTRGGYFENYDQFPWVQQATGGKGVPAIDGDTINFEGIAAAKPDVIFAINETIDRKTYDRLSQIAPTVLQSADYPAEETPWNVQLMTTGKALGKEDRARELMDRVDAKFDEAKAAHPEFAGKRLVSDFTSEANAHYVIGKGDPRNAIFDGLGLNTGDTVGDVSEEKLGVLDGDALFVNGLSREQLAGSPAFQRLGVVRDGRTLYAGSDSTLSGALAFGGPNAMLYALNALVPQLGNAFTGKPVADLSNA